jgi:hypothetical protein
VGRLRYQAARDLKTARPTRRWVPREGGVTITVSGKIAQGVCKPMHNGRDMLLSRKVGEIGHEGRLPHARSLDPSGREEGAHVLRDAAPASRQAGHLRMILAVYALRGGFGDVILVPDGGHQPRASSPTAVEWRPAPRVSASGSRSP